MNISLAGLSEKINQFVGRYHFLLFFIFVFGGLSVAVIIITSALSPQNDGYVPNVSDQSFDKATIKRLRDLRETEDTTSGLKIIGRGPF